MIYIKDGKILVKDGKLCSTCCNVMASECAHCVDTQPAWIDMTFSSFSDAGCCVGGIFDYEYEGIAAVLNNQTYRIEHSSGCVYKKTLLGSFGQVRACDPDSNCGSGCAGWLTFGRIDITLTITATGVDILVCISIGNDPDWMEGLFCGSITCSCDNITGSANNDITACIDTDHCYMVCPGVSAFHPCAGSGSIALSD